MEKFNKSKNKFEKFRRRFLEILLNSSLFVSITAILYPVVRFLIPPKIAEAKPNSVLAGKLGELKPNSGKIFRFGNKPAILINTPNGELKAGDCCIYCWYSSEKCPPPQIKASASVN